MAVALGLTTATGRGRVRGIRFTTLLLVQAGLFAGIEIAERMASSGLSIASLQHHLVDHGLGAILMVGLLVQVVTAWFGSAASALVAAIADRLRKAPPRRRIAISFPLALAGRAPVGRRVTAHGTRGPPPIVVPTAMTA